MMPRPFPAQVSGQKLGWPRVSPVNPEAQQLLAEIRLRQRRLGTALEELDDHDIVCELVHELNNRLTAEMLTASRSDSFCPGSSAIRVRTESAPLSLQ